jgi:5-methyltetrahydropteroyltriglutamate--homocysteine methyltransferase
MSRIERIQTTHVGSLPRSAMVSDVVGAADHGTAVSDELFDAVLSEAIDVEVERQKLLGVDIVLRMASSRK